MADIETGNLYEMNKDLVAKHEKVIRGKALANKIENVVVPYFKEKLLEHNYFMLLCHERRDYTVFNMCGGQHFLQDQLDDIKEALKECLTNRGAIYAIDKTEDKVALEIWLRIDEEMYCYYLFPYDEGIIEI